MKDLIPFDLTWKVRKHQVRDQVKHDFEYRCAYCGRSCRHLTLDHLKPKCRGGSNHRRNLVPACARCNQLKGSRAWQDWYTPDLPFYSKERWQHLLNFQQRG